LALIFPGFIRDDPRLSASSAFYCCKYQLLIPYAQLKTDKSAEAGTANMKNEPVFCFINVRQRKLTVLGGAC
jgi:hypothetical protein